MVTFLDSCQFLFITGGFRRGTVIPCVPVGLCVCLCVPTVLCKSPEPLPTSLYFARVCSHFSSALEQLFSMCFELFLRTLAAFSVLFSPLVVAFAEKCLFLLTT